MLAAMSTPAASPHPMATPVRDRGDACPGTLRLHTADDGALARIRLPGGVLGAAQAEALAQAASRLGDGDLHLTSRGNAQLRGLDPTAATELAALLGAVGLLPSPRHERVRNIVASPLADLADLTGEVRAWLRALDTLLCESEAATALSGRFLFALDDGRGDMAPLGADVTLRAASGNTAWLRIGVDDTAVRVPARDAPRAALLAAEVFLAAARASGAWRVAELPGGARRSAALTREVARRLGAVEEPYVAPTPPPGPPAPGIVTPSVEPDDPDTGREVAALSVVAPLGRLTGAQWRGLVDASREGAGEVRLTPWRGVVVPGLAPGTARARLAALDALGLVTHPGSPWLGVTACVGSPGCAKSLADVRAEAGRAVTAGSAPAPGQEGALLPVHWSGCARRCGHPKGEWVDVVALAEDTGGAGGAFEVARVHADGARDTPVETTATATAATSPNGRTPAETLAVHRRPRIP